ncbi:MAG: hypothetical protein IH614_00370, partial [Desulfuromonadales bacterium]|nr:hypothetical protein [Desulfuromonadales bacterium]
ALDAILGWNVSMYDASWSQWGQMSANAAKGGKLPAGSIWATDVPELTNTIAYNTDAGRTIEVLPINAQAQALYPDPSQPEANQIELEDAAYMQTSDDNAGGAPGATSGGGGGGC